MKRNRGKTKQKAFSFRLLLLSILLGLASGAVVLLIALGIRGYKFEWDRLLSAMALQLAASYGIQLQRKGSNNSNNNPESGTDLNPSPVKPKPFNPPPFASVQEKVEVQEGNYVSMARDLGKRHLELTVSTNIVSPTYIPIQVSSLVNGNRDLALRLFDGEANRNKGKSEQWVWEKVAEDLIRDRR
ncbi:hypothetical protein [Pseudanabaena yagii]|uniref:Uncharacterized protein n=1 Tax=Pseudanabaena yagii GIHE-NHR1 TaxID=2722753 RepID=A0ABX1LMP3_9CYAN|nr:hypothetical protein [Pseudanabaena yagii]NMF56770.1 hypothetical protein [Pseudanabaena yagii GIHE-NHR1]